uniref:E3 ubiquitin-protein ligase Topors n=1 Tax=Daphnia galeata TaxID=27404 RepID=A0A8J2S9I0_9CRUS|nr:unnamed protein product [Daphnia galeata]
MSNMGIPVDDTISDSACAICLGKLENKCFANNCLHEFCYSCLFTWSKEKLKCPLCMQPFSSIIHNVRSNHEYDEQIIQPINPAAQVADFSLQFEQFTLATHANLQILESVVQRNSDSRHSNNIRELRQAFAQVVNVGRNFVIANHSSAVIDSNQLPLDSSDDGEIIEVMRRGRFAPIVDEITLSDDE